MFGQKEIPKPSETQTQAIPNFYMPQEPCTIGNNVSAFATGTYPVAYETPVEPANIGCLPEAAFTGYGYWTGSSPTASTFTGYITYHFNVGVTSANISYSAVNSNDEAYIVTNSYSPTILSNACGMGITSGLNVRGNPTVSSSWGDASITVSSATSFTTITLVNTGGESGWVTGDPCKFTVVTGDPYTPPTQIVSDPKFEDRLCPEEDSTHFSIFSPSAGSGNPITINGVQATASNTTIIPGTMPPYLVFYSNGTIHVLPNAPATFDDRIYFQLCSGGTCINLRFDITRRNRVLATDDYVTFSRTGIQLSSSCNTCNGTGNVLGGDMYGCPILNYATINDVEIDETYNSNPTVFWINTSNGDIEHATGGVLPLGSHFIKYSITDRTNQNLSAEATVYIEVVNSSTNKQQGNTETKTTTTKLYPNPTHDIFVLETNVNDKLTQIELYNALGQKVPYKLTQEDVKFTIDISPLANGTYFLKYFNNGMFETQTVLKK